MNNYDQGYTDRQINIDFCLFIKHSEEWKEWFSGWYQADQDLWWKEYIEKEFWNWMESSIYI